MATQYPAKKGAAFTVVFPILDNDGDLVTAAAGLDSEISKDGGTFADCTNEAAEIATASGMYSLVLTTTEMTADIVAIIVKTTTADAKTTPIVIYTSAQTLDEIDANIDSILVDTGTTLENHLTDIKGTGFAKDTHSLPQCLTATGFSTHAAADIWAVGTRSLTDKADFALSSAANLAIWHVLTADIVTAATIGLLLKTDIDATISSRSSHAAADIWTAASRALSTPADYKATGFSTHAAADIWAVVTRALTDKAGFSISGAKTTLDALNDVSTAEVNTQVDTALADIHLDHLIQKTGAVDDVSPTASSFITNLAEAVDDFYNGLCIIFISGDLAGQARRISDYVGATKTITVENAFTAAPANTNTFIVHSIEILSGAGPTSAQIADAVWDEAIAGHVAAGSFGVKNQLVVPSESLADYKATGFSTHAAADIWTAASRALSTPADYKADVSALALEATLTAMKGATFAGATDSLEAIRDRGDAAWITATGFSTHAAADIWTAASRELSTPANYKADVSALALEATLGRALGLTQENFYIDTCTYDSGKLTAARLRIYDSAANVGTDTGVTATYNVTVTWSGNDMASYKVVKA